MLEKSEEPREIAMRADTIRAMQTELEAQKRLLEDRLGRIKENLRRGFDADSAEMARELENQEVVDALGNEARAEIAMISAALARIDRGEFGVCIDCRDAIAAERLTATPYVERCIDCANDAERAQP